MRGAGSTLVAAAIGIVVHGVPKAARAAETYRLAWSRAEGADACLGEAELTQRVRSRLGHDPFDDAAERVIEGHAAPSTSGLRAELVVRRLDGSVLGRRAIETEGADCIALGQAVTLAVVLTIDPNAPLLGNESTASFPIDGAAQPRLAVPSAPPPPPRPPAALAPPCPSCAPPPARVGLSAGVVGALGLLPRAALGAEVEGAYPALPQGLVLGARFLPGVETSDGHLAIGLTSGKVGYCGAFVDSRVALSLCGAVEAGVTTVVARDLEPVNPGDYPHVAFTAGVRLVWPARSPVQLHAGLTAAVPLFRQQFQVEAEGDPGFQASPLAGLAFLGVGFGG